MILINVEKIICKQYFDISKLSFNTVSRNYINIILKNIYSIYYKYKCKFIKFDNKILKKGITKISYSYTDFD